MVSIPYSLYMWRIFWIKNKSLKIIDILDKDENFLKNELKKNSVQRIIPIAIKRFKEYFDKQLELDKNDFTYKAIKFVQPLMTKNMSFDDIFETLIQALENGCIDEKLFKIFDFAIKLSSVDLLLWMNNSEIMKQIYK